MSAPPPDAIFEIAIPQLQDPSKQISQLTSLFQNEVLPPGSLSYEPPSPQATVLPYSGDSDFQSIIVGLWLSKDGSDADRLLALETSEIIDSQHKVGLFLSSAIIQVRASLTWATYPKTDGRVHFNDSITTTVVPSTTVPTDTIRTVVGGYYDLPWLPDIGFTATIDNRLALATPPGGNVALTATASQHVDGSGLLDDALIIGLVDQELGAVAYFAGDFFLSNAGSGQTGAGAILAAQWPAFVLAGPTGKIQFFWDTLVVGLGVKTVGTWTFDVRHPAVAIAGATSVSMPVSHSSEIEQYSLITTDLLMGNDAVIKWTGATPENDPRYATVMFDPVPGVHTITVSVTDSDNYSATTSIHVTVTVTGGTTHQPP